MKSDKKDMADRLSKIVVVIVFAICILPMIIYGENSFVAVLDYVDSIVGFTKMFHDKGLFYKIDTPMPALQGISTTFYTFVNYGAYNFIMNYVGPYWGHVVNYILELLLGYISMNMLLRYLFHEEENKALIRMIAVAYAILPIIPNVALGYATLPFIIFVFLNIWNGEQRWNWKCILLIFYPFFSSFYIASIFAFGFWLIGIVAYVFHYKKINWNLVVGLMVMIIGTVLVDIKLFYSMFGTNEVLNRVIQSFDPDSFLSEFKHFLIYGYVHVTTVQKYVIIPTCTLYMLYLLIKRRFTKEFWYGAGVSACIIFFAALGALYRTGWIDPLVVAVFPFLGGFEWGRIHYLNRILWYVLFFMALLRLSRVKKVGWAAYLLVCVQICNIILTPDVYNDVLRNLFHNETLKKSNEVTYKEFYSEDLFTRIKEDLDYNGEVVAALGYFPSVLMYNGYNCIDGYMSYYPLKNMVAFRELVEPEFEINQEAQKYFDSWGGRMYLYNADVTYNVTREQSTEPVDLHIDMDVYREFGGKYILSRVPIKNAEQLGMTLRKQYVDEYYYNMYVYEVNEAAVGNRNFSQ